MILVLGLVILMQTKTPIIDALTFLPDPNLTIMVEGRPFITITHDRKIIFDREDHPDWTPDDFAKAFIKALEAQIKEVVCLK